MPKFNLEWSVTGSAVIEADDADEAEQILHEGLANLDSSMFEEVDVLETTTDEVLEVGDDE
jgi:hypothetical protein